MDELYRQRLARMRELRASYMQWHHVGMDALQRGDLNALSDAIRAETSIIEEQRQLLSEMRAWASESER